MGRSQIGGCLPKERKEVRKKERKKIGVCFPEKKKEKRLMKRLVKKIGDQIGGKKEEKRLLVVSQKKNKKDCWLFARWAFLFAHTWRFSSLGRMTTKTNDLF